MAEFNDKKQDKLGGLSLNEVHGISQCGAESMQDLLNQSKVLNKLRKYNEILAKKPRNGYGSTSETDELSILMQDEFDAGAKDQSLNKKKFRKNFGIEKELPVNYLLCAKVYPLNHQQMLRVVQYIQPSDDSYKLKIFENGKDPEEKKISEIYHRDIYQENTATLQLMTNQGNRLFLIKETPIFKAKSVQITFSSDGKFLALFRTGQENVLQIYKIDDGDLDGLMNKIENELFFKEFFDIKDLRAANNMEFDNNCRFLVCYGNKYLAAISLEDDGVTHPTIFQSHKIDSDKFERLIDLQFASQDYENFTCLVACKVKSYNQVVIYDISDKEITSKRSISFIDDCCENLKVKISDDFKLVAFTNGNENYLLKKEESGDGYSQKTIVWLKDKHVWDIISSGHDFLFVCSRDFDSGLDIESSLYEKFKVTIPHSIEPGLLRLLDVAQFNTNNLGFGKDLVILLKLDQDFYYDHINPQKAFARKKDKSFKRIDANTDSANILDRVTSNPQGHIRDSDVIIDSINFNPFGGGNTVMWPYLTFSDLGKTVQIVCAFDQDFVKRVKIPKANDNFQITKTFITEDMDLFVMTECFQSKKFELWIIDLDSPRGFIDFRDQVFEVKKCFEYSFEDVGDTQLLDLKVRSESGKEGINLNKKLFAFFLHQGTIYSWCKGEKSIKRLSYSSSKSFKIIDEENFVFNTKLSEEKNSPFALKKVTIMFSAYQVHTLFQEFESSTEKIKHCAYDYNDNMLILMIKNKVAGEQDKKFLKVIDLSTNKALIKFQVRHSETIGRLVTELYTLSGGHFYFNNSVVKMRYDLLNGNQVSELKENHIFDKYNDILDLEEGEHIIASKISHQAHRMEFITHNRINLRPKKMIVLPFLHERKIFLNKMKPRNQYFYTSITDCKAVRLPDQLHHKYIPIDYMISMDVTADKFFVYSEGGILINRIDYSHMAKKYGKPIQTSNNGRIFIFQKPEEKSIIHILALDVEKMVFMKSINVNEAMNEYLSLSENQVNGKYAKYNRHYASFKIEANVNYNYQINDNLDVVVEISSQLEEKLTSELIKIVPGNDMVAFKKILEASHSNKLDDFEKKRKIAKYQKRLSKDTQQLLENLKGKNEDLKNSLFEAINNLKGSIFYIQKGSHSFRRKELDDLQTSFIKVDRQSNNALLQEIIFTRDYPEFLSSFVQKQFTCNAKYALFWNHHSIWYADLMNLTENDTDLKKLQFFVDPEEKQSFVFKVRAGSSKKKVHQEDDSDDEHQDVAIGNKEEVITIVVRQSPTSDCYIMWNIKQNMSQRHFDMSTKAKVFFDSSGETYLMDKDTVINCEQDVALKTYMLEQVNDKNIFFDYHRGHRFDSVNHNWILLGEYISLSFSFMTFVIRGKIYQDEELNEDDYKFDHEEFNFVLNRKTFLTCDKTITNNHELLESTLESLEDVDPVLLQQVHYYHTIKNEDGENKKITPLHLAEMQGNNRSMSILLNFMSKIDANVVESFVDIMPSLVNNPMFIHYMTELPYQTIPMLNKQTLRIKKQYNKDIISVNSAPSSYVDNHYYKSEMKEDEERRGFKNFPVKLMALKTGYIFTEEGKLFLQAVLGSENLELYECKTNIVIIEFLYKNYRRYILQRRLPIYILQLIIYFTAILIEEDNIYKHVSSWANLVSAIFTLYNVIMNAIYVGQTYFSQVWAYIDIIYMIVNTFISIGLISQLYNKEEELIDIKTLRLVESILSLVIFGKLVHYMQLIDEIAPLVNIIILIFYDIGWFMVLLLVSIFAFANSFYLIGQNQVMSINKSADVAEIFENGEDDYPQYYSFVGSLQHVFLLALGEFGLDDYDKGADVDPTSYFMLWFYFVIACFLLLIHFLNMLIAIMGETFAENNQVKQMAQLKNHLRFVMDHWWVDPIADKHKIQYLITAFHKEEEAHEVEILNHLEAQISDLNAKAKKQNKKILDKIYEVANQVENIALAANIHS